VSASDVLVDGFGRIHGVVHRVVHGLSAQELAFRPADHGNSIAWLVWHLTRIQDDHVSEVAGVEQVWRSGGWHERYELPLEPADTGYGHTSQDVAAVRVESGELLLGYHDAVYEQTVEYVGRLRDADLPRIVDESWDPPVSLGARLVSVLSDDLQHAGQAAYVRGLLPPRGRP
jgi:hypothetical protein